MNIRSLQAMVDETDLAMKSEERKESTFSQNHAATRTSAPSPGLTVETSAQ